MISVFLQQLYGGLSDLKAVFTALLGAEEAIKSPSTASSYATGKIWHGDKDDRYRGRTAGRTDEKKIPPRYLIFLLRKINSPMSKTSKINFCFQEYCVFSEKQVKNAFFGRSSLSFFCQLNIFTTVRSIFDPISPSCSALEVTYSLHCAKVQTLR